MYFSVTRKTDYRIAMHKIDARQIFTIAQKEFWDRIRSRWVLAVAVIFTAFALVIAYFGAAQQGAVGFKGIELTIASLTSLVIYLVPLIALILGYDAMVGERERGSLDLLLSLPITRLELLLGKYLGLAAALTLSTVAGFGLVGVVLSYGIGMTGLLDYGGFILSTLLMGLAFLSLALLISVLATSKVTASGAAIALWFFYVLVYDLILLGLLVVTEGQYMSGLFPVLLMMNPADIFRILNIFSLEEVKSLYGLATVFPPALANPWLLGSIMLFWILTPLGLAYAKFRQSN
jgi:Cu-processing system permease protein